ncbi:MAG TPA: hypothetical protein VI195_05750 [Steroidobacteraceae bacterium]
MRIPALVLAAALAAAAHCRSAPAQAPGPYEALAALAGEWEATLQGFGKLTNSIRLVSKGTAIEETIGTPADNETSVYTRDGASVLLTHFCALTPAGHIARLALRARQGTQPLEFVFVGASNLPELDAPHMRRVRITFSDHDHFREQWTKSENGKDTIFDLHFVRR